VGVEDKSTSEVDLTGMCDNQAGKRYRYGFKDSVYIKIKKIERLIIKGFK